MTTLDAGTILRAFELLNGRLASRGQAADVFLVGGAVMCLVHQARPSTRDVDGWFTDPQSVRTAVKEVAAEIGLAEDWLNDAAKGFIPAGADYETWREFSNLRVSTVDAPTLFAMKCAAARTGQDAEDIRFLARLLGIASSKDALALVTRLYPPDSLSVATRLLLEEMLDGDVR